MNLTARSPFVAALLLIAACCGTSRAEPAELPASFAWKTTGPLITARPVDGDEKYSIKDPSIVFEEGRWHLFATVRGKSRSHATIYVSFKDWADAEKAEWRVLTNHAGYFCAPQVFYFRPHKKWYLICQAASDAWEPKYRPAFATTETIGDPTSWSKLKPLMEKPAGSKGWIDFWVICDERHAYLFYTSNDGHMWRCRTELAKFPAGWSPPELALEGDIFEASHTYRLQPSAGGSAKYLTIVEAQNGHGWRYYKAYTADRLDGAWKPLAATRDEAFASLKNVTQADRWTDSVSHGELIRASSDERLEIDPTRLRFLIQGCLDKDRGSKPYGQIPWRLGMLEQTP